MTILVTLEEVRLALKRTGKTQAQLARELSVKLAIREEICRQVLAGRVKGARGAGRKVAIELGIVADESLSALEVVKAARKKIEEAA